jgi:hypothetical protein
VNRRGAALAAALVVAGCGGGGDSSSEQAGPKGLRPIKLQQADCTAWKGLSLRERMALVDRLERAVAGPRREGKTLPDERAYDTLEARCRNFYARGFLLYEVYTRAAAFDSLPGGGG